MAQVNSSGEGNTVPQLQNPAEETIEIGLSTETIAIASNFGGTDLTIFGELYNADPTIQRQGHYDIIVVLLEDSGLGCRHYMAKRTEGFAGQRASLMVFMRERLTESHAQPRLPHATA